VREFRRRHSGVELSLHELTPCELVEGFTHHQIDVGFTRPIEIDCGIPLHQEKLFADELCVALPKNHPLARRDAPLPLRALARENLVLMSHEKAQWLHDTIIASCRKARFSPRIVAAPDYMTTAKEAAPRRPLAQNSRSHLRVTFSPIWVSSIITMKTFILEGISIDRPFADVFRFVSDRQTLPLWTKAFKKVTPTGALYETPEGNVQIGLEVNSNREAGSVDWVMTFPDGDVERAYSRVIAENPRRTNVQFFLAPKVPAEKLAGAIEQFSAVIREEFAVLRATLEQAKAAAAN